MAPYLPNNLAQKASVSHLGSFFLSLLRFTASLWADHQTDPSLFPNLGQSVKLPSFPVSPGRSSQQGPAFLQRVAAPFISAFALVPQEGMGWQGTVRGCGSFLSLC